MVKVNYQREKRRKDLDRQRKQEEKRARKLSKDAAPEDGELPPGSQEGQEGQEAPEGGESQGPGA